MMMEANRRAVMTGLAASAVLAGRVAAATPDLLFAGTPLAANRVAGLFRRVDLPLPDVPVLTVAGRRQLPQLVGKPRLLTLWAEWCVPCLVEAHDLAALRPQVAGDGFDIVSVLTGSSGKLDYAGATQRLQKAGAAGLTLLVEPDGGHAIAQALSDQSAISFGPRPSLPPGARIVGFSLPCTLLVDRHGRVRGRANGLAPAVVQPAGQASGQPHMLTEQEKQALLGGGTKTAWSTPAALTFLTALRDGALDRLDRS